MKLPLEVPVRGKLIRRYKRFLADIETETGETLTVHCPNPGAMTGTNRPGSRVRCSVSDNPKRKLPHTLEMIRVGRIWVGIQPLRANQLVKRALDQHALPNISGYSTFRPEVTTPVGSRLDFLLQGDPKQGAHNIWLEVKSVTLAESTTARFPDAVTERGRRHLEVLTQLHEQGDRAVLLFVVQRGDCARVEPADAIDPAYGKALRASAAAGVEIMAIGTRVSTRDIRLEKALPVVL